MSEPSSISGSSMPAGPLTPDAGLGAVAAQVAENLRALQKLSTEYQGALRTSVQDRAELHATVDGIGSGLSAVSASLTALGKSVDWLVKHQSRSAPAASAPPVATVAGTATVDVALTWTSPWPDTDYAAVAWLEVPASLLGKTSCTVKSKTAAGCVVTVTTGAVLATGAVTVRAVSVAT